MKYLKIYIKKTRKEQTSRTHNWKVAASSLVRNGRRIFYSKVNFLCRLLFRYPFHGSTQKIPVILPKVQGRVTAKHACTLRMWFCMQRRDMWYNIMFVWCTQTAPSSSFTCGYSKRVIKSTVTHLESHSKRAQWVCFLSGEQRYIKAIINSFFQDFESSREVLVVSQSHKSSATHSNHYVWYFRVSKHWCGCQCLGFLTCAQILMHALANGDTARESALNVDSGRIVPCRTEKLNPFSIAPDFYVRHSTNWAIPTAYIVKIGTPDAHWLLWSVLN